MATQVVQPAVLGPVNRACWSDQGQLQTHLMANKHLVIRIFLISYYSHMARVATL